MGSLPSTQQKITFHTQGETTMDSLARLRECAPSHFPRQPQPGWLVLPSPPRRRSEGGACWTVSTLPTFPVRKPGPQLYWRRDVLVLGCERWTAAGATVAARFPAGCGRGAGLAGRVPPFRRSSVHCARLYTLSRAKTEGNGCEEQGAGRIESSAPSFRPLLVFRSCWRALGLHPKDGVPAK